MIRTRIEVSVAAAERVIVKYVTVRPCSECERPLKGNRLIVRCQTVVKHRRPLSFGIGVFCSVRCLLKFSERKSRDNCGTIRGWAFGQAAANVRAEVAPVPSPQRKRKPKAKR